MENTLTVVSELPSLISNSVRNVDDGIHESLARVGALFNASRVHVMLEEKDGKYIRNTHEWVNQKPSHGVFSWPLYDFEYDLPTLKRIISEHHFFFGHACDMAQDLTSVLDKHNVQSFCVSPIEREARRIGFVGMDFRERLHECRADLAPALCALSGLLALALERKQYQTMRARLASIHKCVADIAPLLGGHAGEDESAAMRPSQPTTLLDAERRLIVETLELYNGNKLKTAKHLGLTWPSLDRRCKKLGIEARKR